VLEGEDLHERAEEIEEVVHELERPTDERKGVDEGARPEEENGDERGANVGPGGGGAV
jgi:hypothetical protein